MPFRNVDGFSDLLESGDTQFDSRILFANSCGGQMRIELKSCCLSVYIDEAALKVDSIERTFCRFIDDFDGCFERSFGCFWGLLRDSCGPYSGEPGAQFKSLSGLPD
jgi:hypothetical protein